MDTLLLSSSYEPLATISWQEAVVKWSLGKVEIIEEYENRFIRSTSLVLKIPSVARLIHTFRRPKQKIRFSKYNVHARDNWKCQYCGEELNAKDLTIDHIIPRSKGGRTIWENVVSCCKECNKKKSNKSLRESKMKLRSQPVEPDWIPLVRVRIKQMEVPEAWLPYVWF